VRHIDASELDGRLTDENCEAKISIAPILGFRQRNREQAVLMLLSGDSRAGCLNLYLSCMCVVM
jgi:hypothetical protein